MSFLLLPPGTQMTIEYKKDGSIAISIPDLSIDEITEVKAEEEGEHNVCFELTIDGRRAPFSTVDDEDAFYDWLPNEVSYTSIISRGKGTYTVEAYNELLSHQLDGLRYGKRFIRVIKC